MKKESQVVHFDNWRAIFAYSVSISWSLMIGTICYVVFDSPSNSIDIIKAFAELGSLWGGVLAVLGILMMQSSKARNNKFVNKKGEENGGDDKSSTTN